MTSRTDCEWFRDADPDDDTWATGCGHYFTIIDGTPADNKMLFCCFCGKPITVVPDVEAMLGNAAPPADDRATCTCPLHGEWIAAADVKRMTRELDVAMNGEDGAAMSPSLCDVVAQAMPLLERLRAAPPADDEAVRKDAERYRWLRTVGKDQDFVCCVDWGSPEEMDAAIDAYLEKVKR